MLGRRARNKGEKCQVRLRKIGSWSPWSECTPWPDTLRSYHRQPRFKQIIYSKEVGHAGIESKEIIMSRVSFPPHTELPWHWHSGEEFFYVIEGSITLKRRGEPDFLAGAGDAKRLLRKPFTPAARVSRALSW